MCIVFADDPFWLPNREGPEMGEGRTSTTAGTRERKD